MKDSRINETEHSRRAFIQRSAVVGGSLLGAGLLNGRAAFGAAEAAAAKQYKLAPNWPRDELPPAKTRGIDADQNGRLYVAGNDKNPILLLSPEGKYLGAWGKGILKDPHGVRVQGKTVWVTDLGRHQALQFTLDGKLLRAFGEEGKAGDAPEQFNRPTDFAFGPDGAIYISDGYVNTRVVCRAPDGSIRKIWGEKGKGPGQFSLVHAIAIDRGGRVYVGDRNNDRVQIFDLKGKYLTEWTHVGKPYGLYARDNGDIFLCGVEPSSKKFRVLKLNGEGKVSAEFGATGEGPGQFKMAHSVYIDKAGAAIVADGGIGRLQKFTL